MKLRVGISPHLLAVVHKVDFNLGWDFFFQNDLSYASDGSRGKECSSVIYIGIMKE